MSIAEPTVLVWTERRRGSWDQCTECAYLMALLYAGLAAFPLPAYSTAERDALDAAAEPDPPEGGSTFPIIDRGALARYGVRLRQVPDGTREGLRAQLGARGRALALAGSYRSLPAGHTLRRWDPDYIGGHAVCVIPLGDGRLRWLDPLAPAGFAGDITDVQTALTFAWIPSDARIAELGELREVAPMWIRELKPGTIAGVATPCIVTLPEGARTYTSPEDPGALLGHPFAARAIGVAGAFGAYVLNAGGLRLFRLADVTGATAMVPGSAVAELAGELASLDHALDRIRAIARRAQADSDA